MRPLQALGRNGQKGSWVAGLILSLCPIPCRCRASWWLNLLQRLGALTGLPNSTRLLWTWPRSIPSARLCCSTSWQASPD